VLDLDPRPDASPCEGMLSGLLVRCGRGDRASLGTLFDLVHGVVGATVRRRLSRGATPEEADAAVGDAVVEVFCEVWRRAPLFRAGADDPLLWVLRLADETVDPAPAPPPALVAS
jgi:DNA-directed RNA polymerase specialized sigma24 family protein